MLSFLRPELLEEPAHSCDEFPDGALYYFRETLQHLDVFWNLWNRDTGHCMANLTLNRALGYKRIGIELCRKSELAWENINPYYITLPTTSESPYRDNLGRWEPSMALFAHGGRAHHFCTSLTEPWQWDTYRILWPQDLTTYVGPVTAYYVDEYMGECVPALAHWRMSEIQCTYARAYYSYDVRP